MLNRTLPNRRLGLSAEIAELEAQISSDAEALRHADGWRRKAEITGRLWDDRKELVYVKLGEISRERAYLRSGGHVMRSAIGLDLEQALAHVPLGLDRSDPPKP